MMKKLTTYFATALILSGTVLLSSLPLMANTNQYPLYAQQTNPQSNIDYNATEKSPTLPLQQTPPPQNSPNSIAIGVPSYYYYSVPAYPPPAYYAPTPHSSYSSVPGGQVLFYNKNGKNNSSVWYNIPLQGQVPPTNNNPYPSFYGNGYFPYGNNSVYIP